MRGCCSQARMESRKNSNHGLPPVHLLSGAEKVLGLFINKWAVRVVHCLGTGPMRHGQLRRKLTPISQKVLTSTLRNLEAAGLVWREVIWSKAPYISIYSLTEAGREFLEPLRTLCHWAEEHQEEIETAYRRTLTHRRA